MATKVYKPKRKISATESEEIKIPASSVDGLSTVATSGSYNDLSNKPTIPDVSGKANLSGGNTFTGKQTLNSPPSDGYSINAEGYVKGSWLQASAISNKGSNTGKVCVFDNNGWIYYRTPAEILTEAGGAKASDIPTNYVTTNTAQDITAEKKFLNTLIVGAKDDGSTGFKVIQGDIAGGDTLFTVSINGIDLDTDALNIPLLISGYAGTSGQVLTSQGAGNAPIWGDITKHGYTELTNEDLNTITEVGWYRAYTGHTCKNSPTTMGFVLSVERIGGTASPNYYIQQTITTTSLTAGMIYRRRSNTGSGTPTTITMGWSTYKLVGQNTDEAFSGRKTFSNGINLNSSLQVNGSSGTAGQVLTSTGTGTPQWTTPTSGGGGCISTVETVNIAGDVDSYTLFTDVECGTCEVFGTIYCNAAQGEGYEINIETDNGASLAYVASNFEGDHTGRGRVDFYAKIIKLYNFSNYTQTTYRHTASNAAGTVTEDTRVDAFGNEDIFIYLSASESYVMNMVIVKTATEV